ncbi:signal recognition particle-docking protein FtsY [Rhodococcus wratislaviensis]|uniref:Signal recognition particle receptor FtsY n=1 Tax=Rhodococcus wratislaviensis TaxID=44752 RepID=A0AB38FAE1_RHOWR|nr:signal recognition particle-docking protein FtsY [Rhodococcus wratislaviensis]REE71867.1 signal recognition particle-docking protein FtsY [Rhodococcus wratislaviensis]SPZ38595.1 signal recognition particle receptor [Rhodococcus wratislaviensis]
MGGVTTGAWIAIAAALAVLLVVLVVGSLLYRRRRISLKAPDTPQVTTAEKDRSGSYRADGGFNFSQGSTATAPPRPPAPEPVLPKPVPEPEVAPVPEVVAPPEPEKAPEKAPEKPTAPPEPVTYEPVVAPEVEPEPAVAPEPEPEPAPAAPVLDVIAPTEGRLDRLRGRLSRSQSAVGKSLLGLLGGGDLDEDSWEEVEDTLLIADLGSATTTKIVTSLREQMASRSVRTEADARALLREVLVAELRPELDRSIRALPHDDHPAVLLVVGVNGTGKTTTTGKLARVLVADGRRVLLGAADTFRAAAADQLQTWAERVGAEVVRGKEAADPAAVAFDAVSRGIDNGVDVVLIDTAGRLHTKTGLMDELGKVKRVIEKKASVDDVLLVLDATIGQNGLAQARVFAEVVDITGVVLTKLDGTAKGGIVFQVQHELGVPVKLVGLGEGADDLAPFEPGAFVDALLG